MKDHHTIMNPSMSNKEFEYKWRKINKKRLEIDTFLIFKDYRNDLENEILRNKILNK